MTADVEEWKTYLWVFFFSYGRKLGKIYTLQEFKKKDLQLTTKW